MLISNISQCNNKIYIKIFWNKYYIIFISYVLVLTVSSIAVGLNTPLLNLYLGDLDLIIQWFQNSIGCASIERNINFTS